MKRVRFTPRHALVLTAVLCAAEPTWATFGYYGHGYGTKAKGMAGATTALPNDPQAGLTNPAAMGRVPQQWNLGASLFSPGRGYTANADFVSPPFPFINPGKVESETPLFLIPTFAINWRLGETETLGLNIAGNGGMNTDYDRAVFANFAPPGAPAPFQASSPTGIDLIQLAVAMPYSRQVAEKHYLGIAPILAIQAFKAEGLEPFKAVSLHPDHLTNRGYDYSFGGGVRVGWLGVLSDRWSVGASYQSKLYMSRFDKYKGLFAEQGDFDIAPTWNVGVALNVAPEVTVALDVQRYLYSQIKAVSNRNDVPLNPAGPKALGTDDGLGFGWEDQTAWKLGVEWEARPDLTLRAGFAKSNQAVPGAQALFNILAPGVTTEHWTLGLTKGLSDRSEINASLLYAPEIEVAGTNPNTGPQTGSIWMDQIELEVTYSRRF